MKSREREREVFFSLEQGEGEGIKALRGPIPLTARSLARSNRSSGISRAGVLDRRDEASGWASSRPIK